MTNTKTATKRKGSSASPKAVPATGDYKKSKLSPTPKLHRSTTADQLLDDNHSDVTHISTQDLFSSQQSLSSSEMASQPPTSPESQPQMSQMSDAEDNGGHSFPVVRREPQIALTKEDMSDLLDAKLKHVSTKNDVAGVSKLVERNAEDIQSIRSRVEELEDKHYDPTRIRSEIEKFWTEKHQQGPPLDRGSRSRQDAIPIAYITGARNSEQDAARREKYEKSRRSLRIWPIAGVTEKQISDNLRKFLIQALYIDESEIDGLGISWVERTRPSPRSAVYDEICVSFADPKTRDHVASKGRFLSHYVDNENKPTAGFRMDVPEFLAADYKVLYDYGWRMKRAHGTGVRRYIKYDEPNFSLILELRIPGNDVWLKIPPRLAVELRQRSETEDVDRARSLLTARPAIPRVESPNFIPITNQRAPPASRHPTLLPAAVVAGTTSSGLYHKQQPLLGQSAMNSPSTDAGSAPATTIDAPRSSASGGHSPPPPSNPSRPTVRSQADLEA